MGQACSLRRVCNPPPASVCQNRAGGMQSRRRLQACPTSDWQRTCSLPRHANQCRRFVPDVTLRLLWRRSIPDHLQPALRRDSGNHSAGLEARRQFDPVRWRYGAPRTAIGDAARSGGTPRVANPRSELPCRPGVDGRAAEALRRAAHRVPGAHGRQDRSDRREDRARQRPAGSAAGSVLSAGGVRSRSPSSKSAANSSSACRGRRCFRGWARG